MGYLGYKPADKPLTSADITDSIITSAKITDATIVNGDIANSTIALAKLSATGTPSAATFLRGDNSWVAAGGVNTPAFFAGLTTDQTISNATLTLVALANESFDTDNAFTNTASNYKFTVPTGKSGKYLISWGMRNSGATSARLDFRLHINGTEAHNTENAGTGGSSYDTSTGTKLLNLTAGDYLQLYIYQTSGSNFTIMADRASTFMCGFKIIE